MMRKSQSAMEYLMTYGWAILAIAIVMVSLYSLGIFNASSLKPTATSGACEVVRTAAQTSLAGQCNGQLPKYVAQFNGNGPAAGSVGPQIGIPSTSETNSYPNGFTFSIWFMLVPSDSYTGHAGYMLTQDRGDATPPYISMWANYGASSATVTEQAGPSSPCSYTTSALSYNRWYQATFSYSTSTNTLTTYLYGQPLNVCTNTGTFTGSPGTPIVIGNWATVDFSWTYHFLGSTANFQAYNTSLDNSSVAALYDEGIGGAPIDLQHLIIWWPLNGNANDYSGNNNDGNFTANVVWNANWQSGYTAPTT